MLIQLYCVIIVVIGFVAWWLIGNKSSVGWLIAVGNQGLFISYAVITQQWGFIASGLINALIATHYCLRWRRSQSTPEAERRDVDVLS